MTGRHPFRYGIYFANVGYLPQEEVTVAEVLREAGYQTGFFGKWHMGTLTKVVRDSNRGGLPESVHAYSPPWQHGFDRVFATEAKTPTYDPMVKPSESAPETWWNALKDPENGVAYGTRYWDESGQMVTQNLRGDDTRVIMDRAIAFIRQAAQAQRPFLAVIWTHAPHLPVVSGEQDREAISSNDAYTKHYYGSVRAMDRQIGRLRTELRATGVASNTLLWFASDNGPEQDYAGAPGSTGGLRGAKRSLYEGGIRVPGVVEWPDQLASGGRRQTVVVSSDIFPTVLDIAGLNLPDGVWLDGMSVRPFLEGSVSERTKPIGFESQGQLAWIDNRYKLIYQPPVEIAGTQPASQHVASSAFELYDLIADPSESTNIAARNVARVHELSAEMNYWRASFSIAPQATN